MSSVVIWRDEATAVTASWNKQAPHTVFVPLRIDEHGICDGLTIECDGEQAAVQAAKEAASERLEQMRVEDPRMKRFRIVASAVEVRDRDWVLGRGLDAAALAEIDALPVSGSCQVAIGGVMATVQRIE